MARESEARVKVLALEPYHGGSHKAFLDGWSSRSAHQWTILGLPPYKWKWRMRHAAVTFARQVEELVAAGRRWDVLFCSDMLNLAEFVGLLPAEVRSALGSRRIVYFHENQLTYPVRQENERDYQFAFTNLTSALAADEVWFNSAFHRDALLEAATDLLRRMPDHQPLEIIEAIRRRSQVHWPGIAERPPRGARRPGPLRILWAARWEHDKNPEAFFEALGQLETRGRDFRVSVIGEQFRDTPPVFDQARLRFADRIDRWGHQPSRAEYDAALAEADVIVSTANHEFFGISVVEAIAAGAFPLLPRRLSYPELLADDPRPDDFLYEGTAGQLAGRLDALCQRLADGDLWLGQPGRGVLAVARFGWGRAALRMDDALDMSWKR